MKISYEWLQEYIDAKLPEPKVLAEGIALHALEVEDVEQKGGDFILDVKVTPDRAHDCLSHVGIAKEVAAIFSLPFKEKQVKNIPVTSDKKIVVEIEDAKLCPRFTAVVIEGVKIGPSPEWLAKRLVALGQRSINNVVDATNYILYGLGKPLHAYDCNKVEGDTLFVRLAKAGEGVKTLDGKDIVLDTETLVIADATSALGIAGVKGGKSSEVDASTTTIILESANFNSSLIRKVSQKVNIKTDAVKRFENGQTSELCLSALKEAIALIVDVAGIPETKVGAITDVYPKKEKQYKIGVSVSEVNKLLGTKLSEKEIEDILKRRGFEYQVVTPREVIVKLAPITVGKPYLRGASVLYDAPDAFDCSSLTSWLYTQAGIQIPRIMIDQYVFANKIDAKDAQVGDFVFTNTGVIKTKEGASYSQVLGVMIPEAAIRYESVEWMPGTKVSGGIDHNGVYMGDGTVLHATSVQGGVVLEKIDTSPQFSQEHSFGRLADLDEKRFVLTVPFERLDIRIKEDVIDDIARLVGTSAVAETTRYENLTKGKEHKRLYYMTIVRNFLVARGFSEVMTYSLVPQGEREVLSSVNPEKNKIRKSLLGGLQEALLKNVYYAPLVGFTDVYTFEFGNIFTKDTERMYFALGIKVQGKAKIKSLAEDTKNLLAEVCKSIGVTTEVILEQKDGVLLFETDFDTLIETLPESKDLVFLDHTIQSDLRYKSLSAYPFTTRDVAVFVPDDVAESAIEKILQDNASPLLVRLSQFDKFQKEGEARISYAYRLVFQSFEKTLTDDDINPMMEKITNTLNSQSNWQVR